MTERQATPGSIGQGQPVRLGLALGGVSYRSQLVAYPYFLLSAILFTLQIAFGLLIVSQYVWPTLLMNDFAFNIGRETHLNLLLFWLLLGLMGASYFLVPEEAESELFSERLAYIQLGVMTVAAVGTLVSFWWFRDSLGKPFTESPLPWPWLIALAAAIFLLNLGVTIFRAPRRTAVNVVLFVGMLALAAVYLLDLVDATFRNLTVSYYWWWWIIHLWVEATWELIAAAVVAYLLIRMTGVDRDRIARWLYIEVILVFASGILGIGHHYYWIGTPGYWLFIGAFFSALEPIPIILMTYDAFRSMRERREDVKPTNRVAWYWLAGSAVGLLVGAGIYGFVHTLPQINQWTHGTLFTAAHGHFAFFGGFAMLVLAAVYYMVPRMRGFERIREGRGRLGFRLIVTGMLGHITAFTVAGIVQIYLWRIAGLDFIQVRDQFVSFWMFWVLVFGTFLVLPGVLIYLWDFFGLSPAPDAEGPTLTRGTSPTGGAA